MHDTQHDLSSENQSWRRFRDSVSGAVAGKISTRLFHLRLHGNSSPDQAVDGEWKKRQSLFVHRPPVDGGVRSRPPSDAQLENPPVSSNAVCLSAIVPKAFANSGVRATLL